MGDQQKRDLIERYIAAYNAFNIDGMLTVMSDDVVFRNVSDGEITMEIEGREELRVAAEQAKAMFSTRTQKPTGWAFSGDTVTVEIDYQAVLSVDIEDGPDAGETMWLKGWSVFRFEDGLVVEFEDHS